MVFLFHPGRLSPEYTLLWSLSIEEQFYMIWPFLVKSMELKELRKFMLMSIGLAVLFRFGSHLYSTEADAHYYVLFCRMDTLLVGGLIAYLRTYGEFQNARSWIGKWMWPIATLVVLVLLQEKNYLDELKSPFYIGYFYFLLALCWGAILLHAIEANTWTERILANRVIRFLGKISYSLYIWHLVVGKITNHYLDTIGVDSESYAIRMVWMSLTCIVVATISYLTIEKSFLGLKKHFPYFVESDEKESAHQEEG